MTFDCNGPILGRIHNISSLGVCMEYFGAPCIALEGVTTVKIANDLQSDIVVEGLPCRPVYDIPALSSEASFSGGPMRQCGFEYGQLSPAVQEAIRWFIALVK